MAAAGAGDLARADRLLEAALERCPGHPGVLQEIAGLRFLQGRLEEASGFAERLLQVDPTSAWGWELLASVRYLSDDTHGALRAWNRLGRPIVRKVHMEGGLPSGRGAAYPERLRRAGVARDRVLTPDALALGVRRLETLPAVSRARLDFRPVPGGRADVEGVVSLGSASPFTLAALPGHLLRAVGGRVALSASNPFDRHDRWILEAMAEGRLREVRGGYALPAPGGLGAWSWELSHMEGRFASPDLGAPEHVARTGIRWVHTHWPRGSLRAVGSAGVDHRPEIGTLATGGIALLVHPPGAPATVGVAAEGWTGGGAPRQFGRVTALVTLVAPFVGSGDRALELDARIGADALSDGAPADLRPRFGAGPSATRPMRARSHLSGDGVVRSWVPGTAWVHGGVELRRWGWWSGPVDIGTAAFADAVQVVAGSEGPSRGEVHLGVGIRARVPGAGGWLRLDWAVEPASGRSRVSAAFVDLPGSTPFSGSGG